MELFGEETAAALVDPLWKVGRREQPGLILTAAALP
jgi:hypothetical protein